MDVSIQGLRDRLEPYLFELGSLHYRFGAGLSRELPLRQAYERYAEFGRPESFAAVREAVERASTDEQERARFKLLLEFLAGQVESASSAEADEAIANTEAAGAIRFGTDSVPFHDALALVSRESHRERRGGFEHALGEFLWQHQEPYARRHEAAAQAASALGYGSYLALREAVTGTSFAELAAQCESVLRQTEDAYRDVLGYALKKVDSGLRALPSGDAEKHDVLHAVTGPWLAAHYRREDLLPSAMRWLADMGFDPNAQGRIQVDSEERPGKSSRSFVSDLHVPDDIRLVVRPGGGLDDYFSLFHEFGHALHFAHVAKTTPLEERRLGDAALTEGYAYAFDHVLLDPAWHKRYLRLPQAIAEDGARLAAFSNLMLLRRYCAKLPYELALHERGPLRPLAESYEDRQTAALFVKVPRGFYLYDVDPQLYAARYLKAWALEARLHSELLERFDQDYWRNPATGRWLKDLFARGQPERADALGQKLGGSPLQLGDAAKRLIAALN